MHPVHQSPNYWQALKELMNDLLIVEAIDVVRVEILFVIEDVERIKKIVNRSKWAFNDCWFSMILAENSFFPPLPRSSSATSLPLLRVVSPLFGRKHRNWQSEVRVGVWILRQLFPRWLQGCWALSVATGSRELLGSLSCGAGGGSPPFFFPAAISLHLETRCCRPLPLLSLCWLSARADETQHGRVISELDDLVWAEHCCIVLSQRVNSHGLSTRPWGAPDAFSGPVPSPDRLSSRSQGVQDPGSASQSHWFKAMFLTTSSFCCVI